MKFFAATLWLLIQGSLAFCQNVQLPPTLMVPVPGLVVIVPTTVDAEAVSWVAMDSGIQLIPPTLLKDDRTAVGMAMQPGTYRVRALAGKCVSGKAAFSQWSECVVTVGTPAPPVPPTPPTPPVPPVPPTPPTPTATNLFIVTVDDAQTRTQQTASLLGDLGYWQGLSQRGHKWAELDVNNPQAVKFAKWTQQSGLPSMIVMDAKDGTVLSATKLPADKTGVEAVVKTLTGGK